MFGLFFVGVFGIAATTRRVVKALSASVEKRRYVHIRYLQFTYHINTVLQRRGVRLEGCFVQYVLFSFFGNVFLFRFIVLRVLYYVGLFVIGHLCFFNHGTDRVQVLFVVVLFFRLDARFSFSEVEIAEFFRGCHRLSEGLNAPPCFFDFLWMQ